MQAGSSGRVPGIVGTPTGGLGAVGDLTGVTWDWAGIIVDWVVVGLGWRDATNPWSTMQISLASAVIGTLGALCNTAKSIRLIHLQKELLLLKWVGYVLSVSIKLTMGPKSVHGVCVLIVGKNITPYCTLKSPIMSRNNFTIMFCMKRQKTGYLRMMTLRCSIRLLSGFIWRCSSDNSEWS